MKRLYDYLKRGAQVKPETLETYAILPKESFCTTCKITKPITDFYINRDKKKSKTPCAYAQCKECHKKVVKNWAIKNPKKTKKYMNDYIAKPVTEEQKIKRKERLRELYYYNKKDPVAIKKLQKYRRKYYKRIKDDPVLWAARLAAIRMAYIKRKAKKNDQ